VTVEAPTRFDHPRTPASASRRGYMRHGVPAIYRDPPPRHAGEPFAMRFLEALEKVLDPIVSMIDLLPAHFDLSLAPDEIVDLVADWLGIEDDRELAPGARRRLVRRAAEIARIRGTRAGVALTLREAFAPLELEIRDSGGVSYSSEHRRIPAPEPTLTVAIPPGVDARRRAAIGRLAARIKPAHVRLEIEVARPKARPADAEEEAAP
jgi:phage tail-like protein